MIILYNFDKKEGTKVFYSYPKKLLNVDVTNKIAGIMDVGMTDGYIILIFENKYTYNFYFEIHSDWARGERELLLLSLVFDERFSIEKEKKIVKGCCNFIFKIKNAKNIFMGFYDKYNMLFKENEMRCSSNKILIEFEIEILFNRIEGIKKNGL